MESPEAFFFICRVSCAEWTREGDGPPAVAQGRPGSSGLKPGGGGGLRAGMRLGDARWAFVAPRRLIIRMDSGRVTNLYAKFYVGWYVENSQLYFRSTQQN